MWVGAGESSVGLCFDFFPALLTCKCVDVFVVFGTRWFLKLSRDINSLGKRKVIGFLFCV